MVEGEMTKKNNQAAPIYGQPPLARDDSCERKKVGSLCPVCGKLITPDKKPGHSCFRRYLSEVDGRLYSLEKAEHNKHRGVFVSMLGF
jgi:hypothetical protein